MASVINTNIASLNTQRNLATSQSALHTSLQRLSSGLRINSAKDDAAGLAIATKMDSQIRGQQVAIRNANDAISFAQTTEGGLAKQTDAIQRSSSDRTNLDAEFTELKAEVTRLNTATKFNGSTVFGTAAKVYQVGADTADTISVASVASLTSATGSIASASGATAAITALDNALTTVSTNRAKLGAIQNRFESVVSNLQVSVENQSAAKSRIMDADFATETANLTRGQILQQAGTAMLAQANSLPNGVLALLRG
jgi:flagellin